MAERQLTITQNGQQIVAEDLNLLGEEAALAGDRVLAELFRMAPFVSGSPAKGILPYRTANNGGSSGLVTPSSANGRVVVWPFRALIGSRVTAATDPKKNWRDIRTAVWTGVSPATSQSFLLAANASGNPRWDLIYAQVTLAANSTSVTRKIKHPTTKVISSTSLPVSTVDTVSVSVVAGTPAGSPGPTWPALPADAGNVYYIPIAYVRVPNGFNATSQVAADDIVIQAPCLSMADITGARTQSMATSMSSLTTAQVQAWGLSTASKPQKFISTDTRGGEEIFFALRMPGSDQSLWSHANLATIDTRNWANRMVKGVVYVCPTTTREFPWVGTGGGSFFEPHPHNTQLGGQSVVGQDGQMATFAGHTFYATESGRAIICEVDERFIGVPDGVTVKVGCEVGDDGRLTLLVSGNPGSLIYVWLDFTAPFSNP